MGPRPLKKAAKDSEFLEVYDRCIARHKHYMTQTDSWFHHHYPGEMEKLIAYFSMEFGFHECVPIYSGGLGILSGDHLKTASDMGIPLVGVGLLYRESYFTQYISLHGHQQAIYVHNDFSTMALQQVHDSSGDILVISIPLDNRSISARI